MSSDQDLIRARNRALAEDFDEPWTAKMWNATWPEGTEVIYHPVLPPVAGIESVRTKTRSIAWELGHGAPVVLVEGRTGGILLSHLEIILPT